MNAQKVHMLNSFKMLLLGQAKLANYQPTTQRSAHDQINLTRTQHRYIGIRIQKRQDQCVGYKDATASNAAQRKLNQITCNTETLGRHVGW
jgi:hypothetical protein